MLPVSRRDEYLFTVPKFDLGKGDIKDFTNELKGFHQQFEDCFPPQRVQGALFQLHGRSVQRNRTKIH